MDEIVKITNERKIELEQELERRKLIDRKEILERLVAARDLGDLKENAEYHTARDEQGYNEARITQLEAILKKAVIIEKSDKGEIGLTSEVVIQRVGTDNKRKFVIVSEHEADMTTGKLSEKSPIGTALLGQNEGDIVSIDLPSGKVEFKIVKVI